MAEHEPLAPDIETPTTAWHPMLVALLEFYLPAGWQLQPEFLLNRLPLRVDIVILRLIAEQAGTPRKLHSILDYLRPHTLIEHKGPTDDLAAEDVPTLLGYAGQYMRLAKVREPADLCLMVVCDHIPRAFLKQIERHEGKLEPIGGGLWRGKVAGFALHGVETRDACRQSPSERLLYAFSRSYLAAPAGLLPMDPEERRVYTALYEQVEQFRRNRGPMAMKDYEEAKEIHDELLDRYFEKMPPEKVAQKVAQKLTPEQRLAGLTPDEILNALTPEAREQLAKKLH